MQGDLKLTPLASLEVSDLWISYRSTYGRDMYVSLCMPRVEALDLRPGVPPEQALVLSTAYTAAPTGWTSQSSFTYRNPAAAGSVMPTRAFLSACAFDPVIEGCFPAEPPEPVASQRARSAPARLTRLRQGCH